MNQKIIRILSVTAMIAVRGLRAGESPDLWLSWERDILTFTGDLLPRKAM